MDFHLQKQILIERAKHQEEEAKGETTAQAPDLMRALALLYREMAEEIEESGLFERRFHSSDLAAVFTDARANLRKLRSAKLVEVRPR